MSNRPLTPFEARISIERGEEAAEAGAPVYAGHHQEDGWKEPLPVFIWFCPECKTFTVSHTNGGRGRIHCRMRPLEHVTRVRDADRARFGLMSREERFDRLFGRTARIMTLVGLIALAAMLITRLS